jgi:hypothetical protein
LISAKILFYNMLRDSHNGAVVANMNYFPALGTPIPKSAWKPRYLDHHDEFTRPVLIRDVRTTSRTFDLNIHGFQFIQLPQNKTRITRDDDEETMKREYYPELEATAKNM